MDLESKKTEEDERDRISSTCGRRGIIENFCRVAVEPNSWKEGEGHQRSCRPFGFGTGDKG